MNARRAVTQGALFAALCAFTAFNLAPIVWAFMISIKQPIDAFSIPPKLIFTPTFVFHYTVWVEKEFWRFLQNSMIISVATTIISVSAGTMTAFALSRMRSKTSRGILYGVLAMRMFPHMLLAVPIFVFAQFFHLIDSYPAIILALVALNQPFTIWLMHSFFIEIPTDLDEAAAIDGCTTWQFFIRIAVPLVRPGIWVTALFSLLLAYNEFLFALILTGPNTKTLPVAIAEYGGEDLTYWSISAAAAIGITLPILIFMMFLQRHLVRGLAHGAVKA